MLSWMGLDQVIKSFQKCQVSKLKMTLLGLIVFQREQEASAN